MIYNSPPPGYKPKLEVVACFIEHGDEVLFLHRNDDIPQGGTWAIPGGKLHSGETMEQAIRREVQEEAQITLKHPQFIETVYIRYPDYDFTYHMFKEAVAVKPHVVLDKNESQAYAWYTREEADALEAKNMLIPDEMPCIEVAYGDDDFGSSEQASSSGF